MVASCIPVSAFTADGIDEEDDDLYADIEGIEGGSAQTLALTVHDNLGRLTEDDATLEAVQKEMRRRVQGAGLESHNLTVMRIMAVGADDVTRFAYAVESGSPALNDEILAKLGTDPSRVGDRTLALGLLEQWNAEVGNILAVDNKVTYRLTGLLDTSAASLQIAQRIILKMHGGGGRAVAARSGSRRLAGAATGNASGVAYLEFDIPGFDKNNFHVRNLRQYVKGRDVGAPLLHKLKQVSIKGVRHCIECGATGATPCKPACKLVEEPLEHRGKKRREMSRAQIAVRDQRRKADAQGPARRALVELLAPLQARAGAEYCFAFNKAGVCTREGCNYFPCCKADTDEVKEAYARAGP